MSYRKFNPGELPISNNVLEETPLHGELNIEQLVFRQIERTELSALQDEAYFASNVRLLLSMVPSHKREEIENRQDEYVSETESLHYKYWCGVPMGTPENPINGSPSLMKETNTDWHKLFEIILEAFEESGLTWKIDKQTIEIGQVPEKVSTQPTPVFNSKFEPPKIPIMTDSPQTGEPEVPKKNQRPCSICGQHVLPGTGKFFNHKLVHIKDCLEIAKTKWGNES